MGNPPAAYPTLSIRFGAALGLVAVAAGFAGGYWLGRNDYSKATRIVVTSCGVAPAEAPFLLPLGILGEHASNVPLLIGPVKVNSRKTVLLRFDPALDGTGDTVVKRGDVLHLPRTIGGDPSPPEEIRLTCRNGALAAVRYHLDDTAASFAVVYRDEGTPVSDS